MSKKGLVAFIIAAIVLLSLIPRSIRPVFGQAASIEAPHFGEGGLPQFEKDPNFPKVPSKWRMGFGSDVAVDAQDHIWILSRPHTLAHPRTTPPDLVSVPAPPVMEFDTDGNFVQAWGGDRKSTRLNSSHGYISYAVFCLKKKNTKHSLFHVVLVTRLRR